MPPSHTVSLKYARGRAGSGQRAAVEGGARLVLLRALSCSCAFHVQCSLHDFQNASKCARSSSPSQLITPMYPLAFTAFRSADFSVRRCFWLKPAVGRGFFLRTKGAH